ncbi:MAG: ABC transporter permease [Gemmatimonadales bacterium]|nr:ABC transporter permease [Gemmatimonadales bacterium]
MSGFGAFLAKERLEIVRTWRIWVIPGMLVFFAVTSPIIALVTPALLGSLAGSEPGMVIQIPDPTALDAYGQFLKNLSQLVILAVVIAGAGTVSAERSSGTAILVLTKPVSRAAFVLAKLASHLGLLVVSTAVAALITLVVTRALFPPIPAMPLFGAVALWLVHAALLVSAMTFFSVVFPSRGGAAGAGLAFFFGTLILAIWPAAARYSFIGLPGGVGAVVRSAPYAATWPVVTGVVATVAFAIAAVWAFRRQEL